MNWTRDFQTIIATPTLPLAAVTLSIPAQYAQRRLYAWVGTKPDLNASSIMRCKYSLVLKSGETEVASIPQGCWRGVAMSTVPNWYDTFCGKFTMNSGMAAGNEVARQGADLLFVDWCNTTGSTSVPSLALSPLRCCAVADTAILRITDLSFADIGASGSALGIFFGVYSEPLIR